MGTPDIYNDIQIWELLRGDYKSGFRHLYTHYFPMVAYFVSKNSGTGADAEDVFQDTMVVIFNKSRDASFSLNCALKTYVYSVARNIWLKKLRGSNKVADITDYEDYLHTETDEEGNEEDLRLDKVKAALELLGENCRRILVMFYYYKKTMQQIAEELGYTNPDNAKTQKYKCLQQLKSKITGANA